MNGNLNWLLIFAGIGFIGLAVWIWRYRPNWSTQKKIVISIPVVIGLIAVVFIGLFILGLSYEGPGQGMDVDEVNKPLNKFEYAEITEAELEEYPALRKAISIENRRLAVNDTELEQIQKLFDKKWTERNTTFVINENLEDELNNRTVTPKISNIFSSEKFTIPENSYIERVADRLLKVWYVMKRYNLFSIEDSKIEKEMANLSNGGIIPGNLKNVFASNGFPLPENAKVSREYGEWIINGTGYTILSEGGKLNVYTGNEKIYEIQKDDAKFRVSYAGPVASGTGRIFKIREKYYSFSFWVV